MSTQESIQIDAPPGQSVDFEHLARVVVSDSSVNFLTVRYLSGLTLELASTKVGTALNIAGLEPAYPTCLHALAEKLFGTPKSEKAHEDIVASVEDVRGCSVSETGRTWVEIEPMARNPLDLAKKLRRVAEALDCQTIVSVSRRSL
ncbi:MULTISPECIES: hypothetical protein [Halorubrum]|uniref:Uncharacterized protein n=1 Tax=Halorubrum hochstenium ATCC 700873 TaxID=1227481 RepID=M0FBN9_9EURY|nr:MULTISPECIES: hypothetical protein [Halorubrum]ELZ56763.1 hypothetical protein C467_07817 [Halorubrum hochstenium ATCC 700873]